jgi:glycine cleavage system aminomethyltransferase T
VTSAVLSPRFGFIALAVIKRPFHKPETDLLIKTKDQEMQVVTDVLPFE